MGIFSRRKASEARSDATKSTIDTSSKSSPDTGAPDTAATESTSFDPARSHLRGGPFDASEAPDKGLIDLGGLRVPLAAGMDLRMEVDQRTQAVTGANIIIDGSTMQIQAFAAPKTEGLWDTVRETLRSSIVSQGGTAETRDGIFGKELLARLPLNRPDGRPGYRPARFFGIDGPRWFVRAVLFGPALNDLEKSRAFETLLSGVVVVRGRSAMAPQELIPLHLPGDRPILPDAKKSPLDPLDPGPTIAEVR